MGCRPVSGQRGASWPAHVHAQHNSSHTAATARAAKRMFVFKKAEKDKGDAKEAATLQQVALTAAAFFAYLAAVRAA